MLAKIRSAGNVSPNPQQAVIATYICFLTDFTELQLTNIKANYWVGQMHCDPPNQNFGWATVHPAHHAVAPMQYSPTVRCPAAHRQVKTATHIQQAEDDHVQKNSQQSTNNENTALNFQLQRQLYSHMYRPNVHERHLNLTRHSTSAKRLTKLKFTLQIIPNYFTLLE